MFDCKNCKSFQVKIMDDEIGVISKVYFGWLNSALHLQPKINSFQQLSDGSVVLSLVKFYDETYNFCRAENLSQVIDIVKAFFLSRNIECSFDEESTDVMFMDILWTFMLNFTFCPGDELKPEDKCIELGRCLLMEWLQIVCPSSCHMDADEELSAYFKENRYIIEVIEAVFSTNLTLPSGSLHKEIFCALVLVEEAFGISKDIIEIKLLIDGECPEFALITYLALLKTKYMDDTEQSSGKSAHIVHEIIAEQPSKESLEFEEAHSTEKRNEKGCAVMSNSSEGKEMAYPLSGSVVSITTPSESGFYSCSVTSHEAAATGRPATDMGETFMASTPRKEIPPEAASFVGGKTWDDFLHGNFDETIEHGTKGISDVTPSSCKLSNRRNGQVTQDHNLQHTMKSEEISMHTGKINGSLNTTDAQVTIIKQPEENESIAQLQVTNSLAEGKTDSCLLKHELLNVRPDDIVTAQLTPTVSTNSDNHSNSNRDSPPYCETPVLFGVDTKQICSRSPEDPLMKLLDNIASKGSTLKEALDQSLLNETLHAETKTYDFDEKVKLMQRVTELESKNLELTLTIENLSASLNDNESRLARESQKVGRISKESDRLLDVNRSFREENLKMEERIIYLENIGMKKDAELVQLKSDFKAKFEEYERQTVCTTSNDPSFVDVDEKEALILGMQHELDEILFEKSKLAQELDNLRDLLKQREVPHDKLHGDVGGQSKSSQLEYNTQSKIAELHKTVCRLEKSLLESHQRNEILNEKLDFMNFSANSHYHLTPKYGCFRMESGLTERNSALNRSFPGISMSTQYPVAKQPQTIPPCYHCNVKSEVSETPGQNNFSEFQYFDRSVYESTLPSNSNAERLNVSDEFLLCPTPYRQTLHPISCEPDCKCGFQSHIVRPSSDVHRNYQERNSCHPIRSQISTKISESFCDKPCCRSEYAVENTIRDLSRADLEIPISGDSISFQKRASQSQLFKEKSDHPEKAASCHVESKPEPTSNLISQSTRNLIDQILAKYSRQELSKTQQLPPESPNKCVISIEKPTDVTPSAEFNSSDYLSLRKATHQLRDQLSGGEPTEIKEKANGDLPVTVKSFEEYLLSPPKENNEQVAPNSSDDLRPFLSRSLASAGVFLNDVNTDLQNKSMLSSVRSSDGETVAPKNSKFRALFSGMDKPDQPYHLHTSNLLQEPHGAYETSSKVAKIGQRLREGLKRTEYGFGDNNQPGQASTKVEVSDGQQKNSGNGPQPIEIPNFQRNGLLNIEDEILSRYKRELRLIDDPKDGKVNSVVPTFRDSFAENIGAIRDQSEVYRSKIQPPKDLFPQDSKKVARQQHVEPHGPSPFADDGNETVLSQTSDSKLIKGYLNELDQKYGKPQIRQNQEQDRTEQSSQKNIVRSSTPTTHIVTKKENNVPPHLDVSYISTASNSVNRNAQNSVSVQFYDEAAVSSNAKAGTFPMQTTSAGIDKGSYSSANGKFIHPSVLFT